jgi:hypothetical protein
MGCVLMLGTMVHRRGQLKGCRFSLGRRSFTEKRDWADWRMGLILLWKLSNESNDFRCTSCCYLMITFAPWHFLHYVQPKPTLRGLKSLCNHASPDFRAVLFWFVLTP